MSKEMIFQVLTNKHNGDYDKAGKELLELLEADIEPYIGEYPQYRISMRFIMNYILDGLQLGHVELIDHTLSHMDIDKYHRKIGICVLGIISRWKNELSSHKRLLDVVHKKLVLEIGEERANRIIR